MVGSTTLCLLLTFLSTADLAMGKGKVIDISSGEGDILQLRGTKRLRHHGRDKYHNALFNNSRHKWNLKDANGNVIIPYTIRGEFDSQEHKVIQQAMRRVEAHTCIRFKRRTSERDYVVILNREDEGCYTSVGRQRGASVLMLESNDRSTCLKVDIVLHELLHVAGLWHEHMRYDRDKYIQVLHRNIKRGYESQFEKIPQSESTVYDMPYDYRSVMHYPKTAFAIPGTITMATRDRKYMDVIGRQNDASANDYEKVCRIYSCSQCNGGSVKPEKDGNKPSPSTPKPGPPTDEKCFDVSPNLCTAARHFGLLDCSGYYGEFCCATCKAL